LIAELVKELYALHSKPIQQCGYFSVGLESDRSLDFSGGLGAIEQQNGFERRFSVSGVYTFVVIFGLKPVFRKLLS
jgi:hypothetical protein